MKKHLAALLRAAADRIDPPRSDTIINVTFTGDVDEAMRHFQRRYPDLSRVRPGYR